MQNQGFGLVEIIVGVSIAAISFAVLFTVAFISLRVVSDSTTKLQAALLLEEGGEALRLLRDEHNGWVNNITLNGAVVNYRPYCLPFSNVPYAHFSMSTSEAVFTSGVPLDCAISVGNKMFYRIASSTSVHRDTSGADAGNILPDGSLDSADADTRKFQVTVFWTDRKGSPKSEFLEMYLTNR